MLDNLIRSGSDYMNMDNLIEFIKDLGLTQEQMGKIINVKRVTYSAYENYHATISLEKLNIIANKYDKSLDFLTGLSRSNNSNFKHIEIDNKKIGQRLKSIRINLNMSQRQFAKELKVSKSILSYYETGSIRITVLVLIEYSKLTGKSIDWLCCKK